MNDPIKKTNDKAQKKAMETARAYTDKPESEQADPLGSYTGNPVDGEDPIQDADDL